MPVSLFDLSFGGALVVVVGVLLEDPDARMQMPWNLREITGRCCHLTPSCWNRSEGLVPELSLVFCAIGRVCGLMLIRSLNGYQCVPRHHC